MIQVENPSVTLETIVPNSQAKNKGLMSFPPSLYPKRWRVLVTQHFAKSKFKASFTKHLNPRGNSNSVHTNSWLQLTAWSGDQLFFTTGATDGATLPSIPPSQHTCAFVLPFTRGHKSYHLLWWVVFISWDGGGLSLGPFPNGLGVHSEDTRKSPGHTTVIRLRE